LVIRGLALDELLSKYRRSQNFNLADVGAFVVAGPLGTAVTKGADFTTLITAELKPDDKTLVSKAHLQWGVENGFLQTEDVAFRTERNRLAFQGGIDFVNDSIPGLTVYLIDEKGCSLMEQRIYGRTNDLKTGKLKIAETLLGSVINLVKSVVGDDCRPVYSGRIVHPIHSE
jgi:AsmA protein